MTQDDLRRHRLLAKLEEALGREEAATLMEHLPPRRWDELATKSDLAAFATKDDLKAFATKDDLKAFATKDDLERLELRMDARFHELTATMHRELTASTRTLFFSQLTMMMTLAGLAYAAARL